MIDPSWFQGDSFENFKDQYRYAEDQLPPSKMFPETRGVPVSTTAYVDASNEDNKVTRRCHTVFIIILNRVPIIWYSKIHNIVEESTFSGDFRASKDCAEHITELCLKLHMLGIPVVEYTKIIYDNESVVKNSSILSSSLNKEHVFIAYHFVRWHIAAGVIKIAWIETNANLADAMTKILTADKRGGLFGQWTYEVSNCNDPIIYNLRIPNKYGR